MSSVKIQINNLKALERLIGGDSEFEIEVRKSVATSFAKTHLHKMISEDLEKRLEKTISKEIDKYLKRGDWGKYTIKNKKLKEAIETSVKESISSISLKSLAGDETKMQERIEKHNEWLDRVLENHLEEMKVRSKKVMNTILKDVLKERMNKLINEMK